MTFNIRYGTALDGADAYPRRRQMLFNVIEAADADVVGLQEALRFQVDDITGELLEYRAISVGRDDGHDKGEASAILYRPSRLRLDTSKTFWLSDTPEVVGSNTWGAVCVRICTWAHFTEVGSGVGFYVFNTHLDHQSQPAREKGIALILRRIAQRERWADPVVFTGDFNSGENNAVLQRTLDVGMQLFAPDDSVVRLVDSYRALHPREPTVGTFNNFKNKTDGEKIDYILITPDVQPLTAEIVRTSENGHTPSDHYPVTARVRLPGVAAEKGHK